MEYLSRLYGLKENYGSQDNVNSGDEGSVQFIGRDPSSSRDLGFSSQRIEVLRAVGNSEASRQVSLGASSPLLRSSSTGSTLEPGDGLDYFRQ